MAFVPEHELDPKVRLEVLQNLRTSAWRDFDSRRAFEWKLALSLWTALAALDGILLTGKIKVPLNALIPGMVVLCAAVVALHLRLLRGIGRSNVINRRMEFFFEGQMMDAIGLDYPADHELQCRIEEAKNNVGRIRHWSLGFQLGVTVLLLIGGIAIVAFRP
jgi:hypothetical protein